MALPKTLREVKDEFDTLEEFGREIAFDERTKLINKLGEAMEPMPPALRVDENQVPGCASKVWVYPVPTSDSEKLLFYADSNSPGTKGIIALILMIVQGKSASEILSMDIEKELEPLNLKQNFTSLRTSGLKNMVLKIYDTARRLSA